jgi:hypothetical protein
MNVESMLAFWQLRKGDFEARSVTDEGRHSFSLNLAA